MVNEGDGLNDRELQVVGGVKGKVLHYNVD